MSYKKQSKIIMFLSMVFLFLFLWGAAFAGAYHVQKETGITQAPDSIPINTVKAGIITQMDSPDVDITIDNDAAVKFVSATDNEITVEYGSTLYRVDVSNEKGSIKIHISYIGNYSKYPAAVLYIPAMVCNDVNIQTNQATADFDDVFQSSSINANMESSSIFYITL